MTETLSAAPTAPTSPEGEAGVGHVIVIGNEKGGAGKSTVAIHLAVALMRMGKSVGVIDLDLRQATLTRIWIIACAGLKRAAWLCRCQKSRVCQSPGRAAWMTLSLRKRTLGRRRSRICAPAAIS
jgi:hypothetical protein